MHVDLFRRGTQHLVVSLPVTQLCVSVLTYSFRKTTHSLAYLHVWLHKDSP